MEHLEGMLDRDQRTAKLRCFDYSDTSQVPRILHFQDRLVEKNPTSSGQHPRCPRRTRTSSRRSMGSSYLNYRNGYLLNTFQSVKHFLIVVCFTLVTLPSISSAPVDPSAMSQDSQGKWINPCGTSTDAMVVGNPSPPTADDLIKVSFQAGIALDRAKEFKDKFADQEFSKSFDELHTEFREQKLNWLDMLPKGLNEDIPEDHLKGLEVEKTLLDVYGFLQRVAVGLEAVVEDQNKNGGKFKQEFSDSEQLLRLVLCEIQEVIQTQNIKMRPDVKRELMGADDRNLDLTKTKTRDFIIYREYMNTLEYTIKAFKYLSDKEKASAPK